MCGHPARQYNHTATGSYLRMGDVITWTIRRHCARRRPRQTRSCRLATNGPPRQRRYLVFGPIYTRAPATILSNALRPTMAVSHLAAMAERRPSLPDVTNRFANGPADGSSHHHALPGGRTWVSTLR
jgi:hypothetical protein